MKKLKGNRRTQFTTQDQSKPTKPLPPAPEVLNLIRARRAAVALAEFQNQTGAAVEDVVSDLLSDLMHWCDRVGQAFPEELRRALGHYAVETAATSKLTAPRSEER